MKSKRRKEDFIVHGRVTQSVALTAGYMATNVPCVQTFCEYSCGFFGVTQKVKWRLTGMMSQISVEVKICCSELSSTFMFSASHNTT